MKFGGTSVGTSERIANTARIVLRQAAQEIPVVVTSAMAGVTNTLEDLLSLSLAGQRARVESEIEMLRARHLDAAAELSANSAKVVARLERLLRELRVLLRGVRLLGAATPRSRDAILGFGELLSQELLALALVERGLAAEAVYAGDLLITDDCFGAARPQHGPTRSRVQARLIPRLNNGVVAILGGHLGATVQGIPTTLGRGGSDLSASVFALALGAERIEIWTDVDGLMTADPHMVSRARLIRQSTFREASELAGFGARVLHPASIDPAIAGGLPVYVRNSLRPESLGTRIGPGGGGGFPSRPPSAPCGEGPRAACAVASMEGLALVRLRAPGWAREPDFLRELAAKLAETGLVPLIVAPGPFGVDLLVPDDERLAGLRRILQREGKVQIEQILGLVALVGEGLSERPEIWSHLIELAGPWQPRRIIQGPMCSSIGVVVGSDAIRELVRAVHKRWFETEGTDR